MAYIRKRGSTWYYTVNAKDPVTNERAPIIKGGFASEGEARKAAQKIEDEIETQKRKRCPNLNDFAKMYFESQVKSQVTDATYINQWHYMGMALERLGKKKMDQISYLDIERFYQDLLQKDVGRGTIKNIALVLNKTFRAAHKWEYIRTNVMQHVKTPTYKPTKMKVWTTKQAKLFLEGTKGTAFHIAYVIALSTGMRIGEILGLQWQDIDFENMTITITRSLKYDLVNRLHLKETKNTSSERTIDIPETIINELREHRKTQLPGLEMVVNWMDKYPYPSDVSREFKCQTKALKLPQIRFHDMRHTHATMLLKMGVHIKIVSERLGHANITTTLNTYSHVLPSMQKEAAAKLNDLLSPTKREEEPKDTLQ